MATTLSSFPREEGVSLTWNELDTRVKAIAGGLNALGVKRGDTVSMLLNNRSEFIPTDLAAVSLGAIPFSIYQTSSPEQIEYVLSDSEANVVIVEPDFLPNLLKATENLPHAEHIVVLGGDGGTTTYAEMIELDPDFDPAPLAADIGLDDPLTLIYTSGTTGPPKGVSPLRPTATCSG